MRRVSHVRLMSLCFALILAIAGMSGCSSTKKKTEKKTFDKDRPEASRAPEWVYAPDEGCGSDEICAAGEGESMSQADSRSRKSLASVFSTKIESQLDIHKTSFSDEEISEMKEFVDDQVNEKVSGVLKAVEIKRRYERDGLFFSLASLDRKKASESLQREINAIDNELAHLYSKRRKSSIKRMMGLLEERAILADKMIVVKGRASRPPVSFSQVQNMKYASPDYKKVFIKTNKDVPVTLSKYLEQTLTSSGYQVLDKMAVSYVIDLNYDVKETYLNVDGFKKFVFTFTASAMDNLKEKVGQFQIVETQTGRTLQDAYLRIKPKIQKEIDNKIDRLNLK